MENVELIPDCVDVGAGGQRGILEEELENEERNIRLAYLGYTYTFDRSRFWPLLGNAPRELHRRLVEFGVSNAPHDNQNPMSFDQFEQLYLEDPRLANIWQECYSDVDDDDMLMTLLKMLQEIPS